VPYIKQETRDFIEKDIKSLADEINAITDTSGALDGTLNYTICRLITLLYPEESYYNYNRIMGLLTCIQQEIYRRRAGPYEDSKKESNGDLPGWK